MGKWAGHEKMRTLKNGDGTTQIKTVNEENRKINA
jgi:hypothetical protein